MTELKDGYETKQEIINRFEMLAQAKFNKVIIELKNELENELNDLIND